MSFYQVLGRGVRVIGWQVALVTDFRNPAFWGCWNHAVKSPEIIPFGDLACCKKTAPKQSGQVISATSQRNLGTLCRCLIYSARCVISSVPLSFLRDWELLDRHSWTRNESDLNQTTIRFFCGFFFSMIFCVRWHLPFPKKNRKKHLTHPRTTWQVRL